MQIAAKVGDGHTGVRLPSSFALYPVSLYGEVRPIGFQSVAPNEPLFRQRPTERFWYTPLPQSQTMYVNFRSYESLGDKARELFQAVDRTPPKQLVIDLRQNGGGDFFEGRKHLNPATSCRSGTIKCSRRSCGRASSAKRWRYFGSAKGSGALSGSG